MLHSAVVWLIWLATLALAAVAWFLGVLNGLDLRRFFGEFIAGPLLAGLAFATVGALVVSRQPHNRIGWLLAINGVLDALTASATQYARFGLLTRPGSLPGATEVAWLNLWIWIPQLMLATTYIPLLYPDGRLPSRRWRPVGWLLGVLMVVMTLTAAVTPHADASLPEVSNPFAIEGSEQVLEGVILLGLPVQAAAVVVSLASMFVRFRRARGDERQALKWFGYALGLVLGAVGVPAALQLAGLIDSAAMALMVGVLEAITVPCLVVAIGVGVLRYGLWDIDLLINRTLVYATLTGCVLGMYILVVGYIGAVFHARGDAVSLLATGLVAVAFQPLRERLQRAVNHLLYGQRDEPYAVLTRLGQRLEATLAPEGVLPTIVRTVAEALRLPYVAVALSGGARGVVVGTGTPDGEPTRLPLVYQQEVVGELLLCARRPGEAFSYADRRLLEDLARQVGVAAHAAQLTSELQHSRERLVTTREEERRRLRRDLHDGLGPVMAGLTLQLDAARALVRQDPPAAEHLLGELKTQAQTAVADIRRLVYALRPPALDDLGLVPALRATAAQYEAVDGSPLITIEAPTALPAVPAAVEVAIYRITQEALANVVRHAQARSCEVRLTFDAGAGVVYLAVADDGRGVADDSCPGIGLRSMRERTEELGGMFMIDTQPSGGTRLTARLPCKAEPR